MTSSSTFVVAPVDKKVVLFGRTGDGKSTIGNVLVAGGLQPVYFASSDAAKGHTTELQKKSGRGWIVTDTVGLGEAHAGTRSNAEAKNMVIDFLKKVNDEYSHVIYVQKARRRTILDNMIWELFANIFVGAEDAFVILITAAEPGWLEENQHWFPKYWRQYTLLTTDIPPVNKRAVIERRYRFIREQAVRRLQEDLENHFAARGYKYSSPYIARMNDVQLEEKSRLFFNL